MAHSSSLARSIARSFSTAAAPIKPWRIMFLGATVPRTVYGALFFDWGSRNNQSASSLRLALRARRAIRRTSSFLFLLPLGIAIGTDCRDILKLAPQFGKMFYFWKCWILGRCTVYRLGTLWRRVRPDVQLSQKLLG